MKRTVRLRTGLLTAALVAALAVGWVYFAPTSLAGSTSYVVTSGTSMEPRFHSGDLAILRPAAQYKVGEIVGYHSTLLHVIVLHRIVARDGDRYVFKGDNNNFLDPLRPARSEVIGALWFRVPHGGRVIAVLHDPVVAAVMCALLGLSLFVGAKRTRGRRNRARRLNTGSGGQGAPSMKLREHHITPRFQFGPLIAAAAAAAAAFGLLALLAFTRPLMRPTARTTPFTQEVSFGYSARVRPSAVYPHGFINTGDPIFLSIVHRFDLHIDYQLTSSASSTVAGAEDVVLKLLGPGGWSRDFVLVPATHFTGSHTSTDVTVNILQLQSRLAQVERLTGVPTNLSISVGPRVHIRGAVADRPVTTSFAPMLNFELAGGQLQVGTAGAASAGSTPTGGSQGGYDQVNSGTVSTPSTAPNRLTVFGFSPRIELLRWIALIGLLISSAVTLYCYVRKRGEPFEETFRIQAKYGYMIVPIVGGEDLGWPPVDVPDIKALVRLAESGQRLILHNRSDNVDTYMVNEEGTVYRYQVKPSKVVWGDWSEPTAPLEEAA